MILFFVITSIRGLSVTLYMCCLILSQARVLREFSPEEVTANIYTMVDVLLHHIQLELQRGHLVQVTQDICFFFFGYKSCLFGCLFLWFFFSSSLRLNFSGRLFSAGFTFQSNHESCILCLDT